MKQLSATDASRNFADLLDSVESRGDSFLVVRHGQPVAEIRPVSVESGRALKEALRANRPDREWARELRELRGSLEPVTDPWDD